jgi:2-keto-4-pentenoate hydratase/2-oxohepta-3-ene-1,7-dioic acid hydratase in catechol pathway
MRFFAFRSKDGTGLAVRAPDGRYRGLLAGATGFPGDLRSILRAGGNSMRVAAAALSNGAPVNPAEIEYLPPIMNPDKIICVGLNYADHTAESGFKAPTYPAIFTRYATTLVGHGAPIIRPRVSEQLDYEGELVAVIGRAGRHIPVDAALDYVAGYSIFNDGSVRDYQFKSPQWTMGKNFDGSGPFGPDFVTADELPPGATGLRIQTRLNGMVVQSASTADMVFNVATLVSVLSVAMTLAPGDVIVTGTPAGIGAARKPPLWMKAGDVCEVEIESIGVLRSPIADEPNG